MLSFFVLPNGLVDFVVYRTHRFWPGGGMNLKRPLIYFDVKPENEFSENPRKKRTDGFFLFSGVSPAVLGPKEKMKKNKSRTTPMKMKNPKPSQWE
jgi:hypothetical protein